MVEDLNVERSKRLYARAIQIIPGGSQTNSLRPDRYVPGAYPAYIQRGRGSHVWDVDGNEYIDYICHAGPIILGHSYPRVVESVKAQTEEMILSPLLHPLELKVADEIIKAVPCAEMVRFMKTGAMACAAAVRTARAYTGREIVAHCGYHGCLDWWVAGQDGAAEIGVPKVLSEYITSFEYLNLDSLEQILKEKGDKVACVIMTPVHPRTDASSKEIQDFLRGVRELVDQYCALLVFDEIKTGFRLSIGGAQEYYGVTPDLACFAKAMANGLPISALTGTKEVMSIVKDLRLTTTYGGECLSLAGALATIRELKERNAIGHIWTMGEKVMEGFNSIAHDLDMRARCNGLPPMFSFRFECDGSESEHDVRHHFLQDMAKRGVLMNTNESFITYSHSREDVEKTVSALSEILPMIRDKVKM